jgi:hypothetical protein
VTKRKKKFYDVFTMTASVAFSFLVTALTMALVTSTMTRLLLRRLSSSAMASSLALRVVAASMRFSRMARGTFERNNVGLMSSFYLHKFEMFNNTNLVIAAIF